MAVLFAVEEHRCFGETDVCVLFCFIVSWCDFWSSFYCFFFFSVRFAPPLVISEEDMKDVLWKSLVNVSDQVSVFFSLKSQICYLFVAGRDPGDSRRTPSFTYFILSSHFRFVDGTKSPELIILSIMFLLLPINQTIFCDRLYFFSLVVLVVSEYTF